MSHYCGIDLHSNNHVVVVIDDEDKRVLDKRLSNDLSLTCLFASKTAPGFASKIAPP